MGFLNGTFIGNTSNSHRSVPFFVDTGCSCSTLGNKLVERLGLTSDINMSYEGSNRTMDGFQYSFPLGSLSCRSNSPLVQFQLFSGGPALDINFLVFNSSGFDVILGLDMLLAHKMIMDFGNNLLRVRGGKGDGERHVVTMMEFPWTCRYINASFSGSRPFFQRSVPVLIDSGASISIISSRLVEEMGLMAYIDRKNAPKGDCDGLGKKSCLGQLPNLDLLFGKFPVTMKFDVSNDSSPGMQLGDIVLLGVDFFGAHRVVLDFGKNVMYAGGTEVQIMEPDEVQVAFALPTQAELSRSGW